MQRDVDDRLASTDGRPLRAVWACATGGFALLAGLLVWLSRWHLNPDAVAYVQIARHYAGGRFGLAVNSWFGPLLSWLLVPAVRLGLEPVLFVRLMNVGLALGFAVGAVALTARLGGGRGRLLAYVCALLLGVTMVPWPVTPDLLLTCLLTWYFVLSLDLAFAGSSGRALAVGLLGGLCYLAKAYALLFVVAHLVLTFAIRHVAARRPSLYCPTISERRHDSRRLQYPQSIT